MRKFNIPIKCITRTRSTRNIHYLLLASIKYIYISIAHTQSSLRPKMLDIFN